MNKGMYITIMTDEFGEDVYKVLPLVAEWGTGNMDFRGLIKRQAHRQSKKRRVARIKKDAGFLRIENRGN